MRSACADLQEDHAVCILGKLIESASNVVCHVLGTNSIALSQG
jgi:hypothetical protein